MMSKDRLRDWLRRPRVRDGLAIGLLLALIALFLGPALLPGRVLMPLDIVTQGWPPWQQPNRPVEVQNWLLTDVVNYIFPVKQFMAETVRSGTIPLWNPYVLTGVPFTYNTQAGLFYPLSLLYYLLPWTAAVDLTIALQLALGCLFMFAYLRLLDLRRLAAVTGAALFALNGLMMVWLEWQVVHAAIIWLPLQLYLLEKMVRAVERQTGRAVPFALLTGLAFAVPWLGGHWNWTLYTSMTLAVYGLWRLWPLFRRGMHPGRLRLLALYLLPFLTGIAAALVQIWPAFNYLSQSHRRPLPLGDLLRSGLWDRLVVAVVPNFFGNPSHNNNWWGIDNYNESTFYLGLLPLFLIVLALFLRKDTCTRFYAAWGAVGFLWMVGPPAYTMLAVLPVFNGLYPGRAAILVVFCGSVLAALSLDRLLRKGLPSPGRLLRVVWVTAGVLVLVATGYAVAYYTGVSRTVSYLGPYLLWALALLLGSVGLLAGRIRERIKPAWFGGLALAVIVLDLYVMSFGYNTISPVADFYPDSPIVSFLKADPEPFRLATPAEGIVFYPNTSLMARLGNASGYEPGLPRRHVDYYNAAEGESAIRFNRILMPLMGLDSPLFAALNVKYIPTIYDWWAEEALVDVNQERAERWLPLGSARIGQTFTAGDAGLQRVDLPFQVSGDPAGTITVRIFTGDGGLELANASVDVSELAPDGRQAFFFTAFPSEWGREFRLEVTYPGTGQVAVGGTEAEAYPQGSLLINGEPANGDLAFTSYYLPRPDLAFEEGKTRIYTNPDYFPRAYAVHEVTAVEDHASALAALLARQDDLADWTVLEATAPVPQPADPGDATSSVTITQYGLNRVTLQAEMAADGYVILADTFYPGWWATVDGVLTLMYQANTIARAVFVPAGTHTVEFIFRPLDFYLGALVSGLTWIIVPLVVIGLFWRNRREKGNPA